MNATPHKLGWLPDYPSAMKAQRPFVPTTLTAAPDWKPVNDQSMRVGIEDSFDKPATNPPELQNTSDCVARAINCALEYLVFKKYHKRIKLSDRFLYYQARAEKGMEGMDIGCYPQDALNVAFGYGVPLEIYCPNDAFMVNNRPTDAAYQTEQRVFLTDLNSVVTLLDIQRAICERTPFCQGTSIYENFYFSGPDKDGFVPDPAGRFIGGHYDVSIGFSLKKEACETRGSWGDTFGPLHGYYWRRWSYLLNQAWSGDMWALRDAKADFLL